jgi:hypothetical protein
MDLAPSPQGQQVQVEEHHQLHEHASYVCQSLVIAMLAYTPVSEAYIETSSNVTSTRITSGAGGSTFFQPQVGTATAAAASGASSGSAASGAASGANNVASGVSGSAGSAAAAGSSRAAGDKVAMGMKGVWGIVGAVVAVGAGMKMIL